MKTDQENQDLVELIFSPQKNKMASLCLGIISGFTWQVQVQVQTWPVFPLCFTWRPSTQPGGQPTATHQKIAANSYLRKKHDLHSALHQWGEAASIFTWPLMYSLTCDHNTWSQVTNGMAGVDQYCPPPAWYWAYLQPYVPGTPLSRVTDVSCHNQHDITTSLSNTITRRHGLHTGSVLCVRMCSQLNTVSTSVMFSQFTCWKKTKIQERWKLWQNEKEKFQSKESKEETSPHVMLLLQFEIFSRKHTDEIVRIWLSGKDSFVCKSLIKFEEESLENWSGRVIWTSRSAASHHNLNIWRCWYLTFRKWTLED